MEQQQQQQLHLEVMVAFVPRDAFASFVEDVVGEGEDYCRVAKDCGVGDLGDDEGIYQAEEVVVVEDRVGYQQLPHLRLHHLV
uniref:Uncharacterized protein n=1 Tax=Globodera rostochiensis TaxID=31243 RepID=A0A914HUL1_GLORO